MPTARLLQAGTSADLEMPRTVGRASLPVGFRPFERHTPKGVRDAGVDRPILPMLRWSESSGLPQGGLPGPLGIGPRRHPAGRGQGEGGRRRGPRDLSVILVWLDGGPPQHETYDPKPEAPAEFRGPLGAMNTCVPGISISELLPYHARMMDKMSIIRSMHHNTGDHFAAAHWMLTGYHGSTSVDLPPQYPSAGSIISKLKGAKVPGMPAYVGLPNTHSVGLVPGYHGGAYLGVANNPVLRRRRPEQRHLPGPEPDDARRDRPDAIRRPSRPPERLRRRPSGRGRLGPDGWPRPLLPGSVHDGVRPRRPCGVRHPQGEPEAPRPLRPAHVGPERLDGPSPGRGRGPVRHPDLRRLGLPLEHRGGDEERPAGPRQGRGEPGRRPQPCAGCSSRPSCW